MEYGLLGARLGHSWSPMIHRVMGDYDYRLTPVSPEELARLLQSRDFKGLNVTIPYKRTVLPFCDEVSDAVRLIGSANTLVNRGGRLFADNTDLAGFRTMLERAGISLAGRKVVILGSGGTSLTARAAAETAGAAEVVVVSRSGPVDYGALYRDHTDAEVLVNATPVGMYPDNLASPADLDRFPRLAGVADVIYNPARTALMMDAEERGIPCAGGLWMLSAQAWHAAKLFLGRDIPEGKVAEACAAVRRQTMNLVLIGMPGSGKSTLGRMAAERLGRPFVDLDEAVERGAGRSVPDIFRQDGEAAFRALERQAAAETGKRTGLVVATGGGAVLSRENVRALRQNGVLAWVRRPLEMLATGGRPLSVSPEALARMERERTPVYEALADLCVDNGGDGGTAVRQLMEGFDEAVDPQRAEPEHARHP